MSGTKFECSFCCENKSETHPHLVDGYPICVPCSKEQIIPMFEKALTFEHHYPVRWGGVEVDLAVFHDSVTSQFIDEYLEREQEYKTPIEDRVYCQHRIMYCGDGETAPLNVLDVADLSQLATQPCGAYVGENEESASLCNRCMGFSCLSCGEALTDLSQHMCAGRTETENGTAFEGLTKGVDFQICPHCKRSIQLSEACNEMSCVCGGHFCMICGEPTPADGRTTHWSLGGCPRWGPKSTARPDDFDIPAPDRVVTQQQFDEALRHAQDDELVHPTGQALQVDHHLRLVSDRDRLIEAMRELENNESFENLDWQLATVQLLHFVAISIDMILVVSHTPARMLPDFIVAFNQNHVVFENNVEFIPREYWDQHDDIEDIVEYYIDQVFHLTRMLEARVAASAEPAQTVREEWLQQRRMPPSE